MRHELGKPLYLRKLISNKVEQGVSWRMRSSPMITLFSEPDRPSSYPSTYLISMILHVSVGALLTARVIEKNHIIERFPESRFSVRVLDFHSTPPSAHLSGGITYRGPVAGAQAQVPKAAAAGSSAGSPSFAQPTAKLMPAPQTLVQPDLPNDLATFKKVPVPLVVLWSPEKPEPQKVIVPPTPSKAAIAAVRPSLDAPINEESLADLRISSTTLVTQTPAAPPSTTSPIVVHGPEEAQKVPQTTSTPLEQQAPTPARVLSLSDTRVAQGVVVLPQVNEAAGKNKPGATIPGVLKDTSATGVGSSNSKINGTVAGNGAGTHPGPTKDASSVPGAGASPAAAGNQAQKSPSLGQGGLEARAQTAPASTGQGTSAGSGNSAGPSGVHISLPRDGQFGVVVFGSSIADSYPETAELWSGRMASTVYLRVGLPKSWILQYSLPRLADAASAGGGRLEAPWPYEIVRPNLNLDNMDSDALILHGFVNKDGRFEKLEVAFPAQFVQSAMVLNVLNQWQFRPAKQNGQMTAVEVLLIIPDQAD
jgi:hypothetical protein